MSKSEFVDYYSLLEIAVESNSKVINKAYRKKALQYHPDKNKGNDKATEIFKQIKEAKEILLDEEKRKAYDKQHRAMLLKRAGKEKMDKRQRELTETLFAREEEAKRRRKGELSEKERLHFRLMQINQENEKTINQMLHDNEISKQTTNIHFNPNENFERPADYGTKTMERLRKVASLQKQVV